MAKPVIFGDFYFRTKKSATDEIRKIINGYEVNSTISKDHQLFFEELFKLHDEYKIKIGVGIKNIQVEKDFGNKCLFIHRLDGSKIDISWVHCIRPANLKTTVSVAFRRAVKHNVITFKTKSLQEPQRCPILNIPLDFKNCHVSYLGYSFEKLLSEFLTISNNKFDSIELENPEPQDTDQRGKIKDIKLRTSWVEFHREKAILKLLSADANLRK